MLKAHITGAKNRRTVQSRPDQTSRSHKRRSLFIHIQSDQHTHKVNRYERQ